MRCCSFCLTAAVVRRKMATVKSLEDMLSSEYDESAVNALVGSLESQLASSNAHVASQELSSVAVSANHVNNATHVDGNVMRLLDGPKLDMGSVVNPVGEINKSQSLAVQPNDINCAVTTSNSTSVMVTLPGALPASGYITQVTGPSQQSLFTPSVAGIVTSRSLTVHNPDVKIVYSSQSPVSHLNTVTSSNNSMYPQRNNLKLASLPNGSPNVGIIAIRANPPLVAVTAVNPIIAASSTTSMSTIHDLANIASQQTPIVIPNACQPVGTTLQGISTTPHPAQIQVNAANGKQMIAARIQRDQVNSKIGDKNAKQTSHAQEVLSTPSTPVQNTSISQVNSNILQVNNPSVVSKAHNQASQPVGIVSNSSNILSGVQIVNVNPTKITTPAVSGQRTLAPRVVLSSPLRLTANPQILTTRPGVQVAGQSTITLPHGVVRGAILVKTENGQFQVVNVAPSLPASSSSSPISNAPTYRLQSVQPGAQVVRTMSQPMAVTVPVSATSNTAKTTQQATVTTPQTIVGTLLQQGPQLSEVSSRLTNSIITSAPGTPVQQSVVAKVTGVNGNLTSPLTVQTTTANSQSSNTPSQMSPNTAKRKCKNFLSTLIRLAEEQPSPVAKSVRSLIQGIIDGTIPAEEFTAKLQKELHSAPQPYLVPFLKKNLPFLRQSLITQELTIEGIRPPPPKPILLPPTAIASVHQIQVGPKKTGPQQAATQLRLMSPASGGALTAQLLQTSPSIMAQRFPRIPAALVNQGKSLLVATSGNKSSTGVSAAALSPATVGILQAKSSVSVKSPSVTASKDTSKRNFNSSLRDDDDINDVAAMGGVNLIEESQRILASNADIVGTQIRSCKDESFLCSSALQRRVSTIATKLNVEEVSSDVMSLIAHATQERLKSFVEKLGIIAEHRIENTKSDMRYEVTQDVKYQLKFLEELDRLEKRRHEEQEREVLLRAAKSRSKVEDPEQLKLKQKAKEMQRAEMEEMRQREANATALLAIGPRKKLKLDSSATGVITAGSNDSSSFNSNVPKVTSRPRVKRVNFRDFLFLMEQERDLVRTPILYKAYTK